MKLLAIETATAACAIAVELDGRLACEVVASTERHHTEALVPTIAAELASLGLAVGQLDGIVVDVGPGLFTGLRVGLATARSLAMAAGVDLYCVSSLALLANDSSLDPDRPVVAVVDARRGEVFAQRFGSATPSRPVLTEPMVLGPAALAELLATIESPLVIVGDGAARYADELAGRHAHELRVDLVLPSPAVAVGLVSSMVAGLEPVEPSTALPLYLRDPDAVANFHVAAQARSR